MGETGSETGIEEGDLEPQVIEQEAREQGWLPKEEFKGDPSKWVDADEFVERGRHVMPLLRKNNERLLTQIGQLTGKVAQLEADLQASKADFETFEEFHNEELARRGEVIRAELLSKLKIAKDNQDTETEVQLTDQLIRLNKAEGEDVSEEKPKKGVNGAEKSSPPVETPEYRAWKEQNPWFEVDPERTYEAMEVANRMLFEMRMGKLSELRGPPFYQELNRRLNTTKRPTSRVEGSRGGSTGNNGRTGRTYADLPSEAKAICDRYAEKFVKPNGRWKSVDEYRKHYVDSLEKQGVFNERG